ncbi:MAG: hypothetical protein HY268_18450 [Deltaproteobacteria bacterium]|nr:hypothetical protein [Deltaproteobacteria bacterium]
MESSQKFVLLKKSGTTESALPRLLFLNDHVDFVGGGERMLVRVAAIAQRHARIDLGLLWGRGRCVLPEKDQDYFAQIATFAFPERVRQF